MQRELTYQLPFERLRKLSRAASRKAYPKLWWWTWLWIALVLVALFAILYYSDALDRRFDRAGIPFGALVVWVGTALVFLAGGRKVFGTGPIIVSRPTRSLSIGKASSRLCNHLAQLVSAWL